MRKSHVQRKTRETSITINLNIDGTGKGQVRSGIGFFDHMLESFAIHGVFDIKAKINGDLHIDQHHTVEDTGIALGQAFDKALGSRRGIERAGFFMFPMDEALAYCAIDISGRPFVRIQGAFRSRKIGNFDSTVVEDFFHGFATALRATVHIKIMSGRSDHHKAEALFKSFGKAMRQACMKISRAHKGIPSTKGAL
jgi:imidazoleglycerol-phosphate dehydratase